MVIFRSYVSLPKGICIKKLWPETWEYQRFPDEDRESSWAWVQLFFLEAVWNCHGGIKPTKLMMLTISCDILWLDCTVSTVILKKQALPHWLYKIWEAPWEYHSPRVDSEDYKKMMVPTPNNWYSWWQMFMVCGKTLETNTMWDGFWLIFPWNRVPTSWLWTKKHWSRTSPYFFPHAWAKTWLLIPHWQILCCKHIVILSLTKSTQNCLHAESRPERLLLHPSTPLQLRGCFAAIDVREEGHIMPQWSLNTCWIMLRAYY